MTELLLFHHAQGRTEGCRSFADRHLFADSGLPDYDESAATRLKQRVLSFLDNIE